MENSHLAKISPELRILIYEYTLDHGEPFEVKPYMIFEPRRPSTGAINPLALTQTCRNINTECQKIFYTDNTFIIKGRNTGYVFANLDKFSRTVGRDNTTALRSLILDIGTLYLTSFEEVFSAFSEWTILLTRLKSVTSKAGCTCNFMARVRFAFIVPRDQPAEYEFDLDFGCLEKSWSLSMQRIETLMVNDPLYWERLRPMFDDVLENLRLVDAEAPGQQ